MANRFNILTTDILQPTFQSTAVLPSEVSPIQKLPTEIATGEVQQRLIEKVLPKETAFLKTPEGQRVQEIGQLALGVGLTAPVNVAADTALSRLISTIKSAKPIGKKIIAEQAAEKASRAGKAGAILEKVEGERAFIQAKGQLKGPLIEKPRFEPLRAEKIIEMGRGKIPVKVGDAEKELASLLKKMNNLQGNAKEIVKERIRELTQAVRGVIKPKIVSIPKELEPLAQETRKFKSADDYFNGLIRTGKYADTLDKLEKFGIKGVKDFYNQAVRRVEGIGEKLSQGDIDTLFVQIQRHPTLTTFEKISAADGFSQLMSGQIPQPSKLSLLEDVFGKELIEETLKKRPIWDKTKDLFTESLNIPRSLMASFDMSAPLRQGIIFTTTKPGIALGATKEMFRQAFSEKNYVSWLDDIKKDPFYQIMKESDLYIADPRRVSGGLAGREERFMSNLAERIPFFGKLIKASERAYTSYLNKLRVDTFSSIAIKFQKMGLTQRENLELYQSLAGFINNATGRGDLGKLNRNAQLLNTLFFSPRLIASRFNMLNPQWYIKQPPLVRKEAIKSFAEFVGIGTGLLTLAKLTGADVEVDPRSTDFGKIRIGNTRWDIWGGFQQWVRVFSQIATGERKTQKGKIIELSRKKFPFETKYNVAERFFRQKLAPGPGWLLERFEGSTLYGETLSLPREIQENVTPMYINDIKESFEQLGPWSILTTGVPAFFGVGVQTFEEKEKKNRFNF